MRDYRHLSFEAAVTAGYRSFEAECYGSKNTAKLNADGAKLAEFKGWRIVGVTDRSDATKRGARYRRTFWCVG